MTGPRLGHHLHRLAVNDAPPWPIRPGRPPAGVTPPPSGRMRGNRLASGQRLPPSGPRCATFGPEWASAERVPAPTRASAPGPWAKSPSWSVASGTIEDSDVASTCVSLRRSRNVPKSGRRSKGLWTRIGTKVREIRRHRVCGFESRHAHDAAGPELRRRRSVGLPHFKQPQTATVISPAASRLRFGRRTHCSLGPPRSCP